jgi:hypothetical protein
MGERIGLAGTGRSWSTLRTHAPTLPCFCLRVDHLLVCGFSITLLEESSKSRRGPYLCEVEACGISRYSGLGACGIYFDSQRAEWRLEQTVSYSEFWYQYSHAPTPNEAKLMHQRSKCLRGARTHHPTPTLSSVSSSPQHVGAVEYVNNYSHPVSNS